VELLVAIAVLSILVLVLMSMLGSLTNTWAQGQARNERRDIAQAVFDRMSRDLAQVSLPASQGNTNALNFVINPSWITKTPYAQSIFFQAPVATDGGTNGNMAVVGYFVQWVNGTPGTPTLTRLLINPSSSDYAVYSGTPNTWVTDALLTNDAPATAPTYTGLLAERVLGLWVQALDSGGNPITQSGVSTNQGETFDSRYPYAYTNYNLNSGAGYVSTNAASSLPASLQVAIAVVDARTAARITSIPTHYAATGNFWNDVQNFVTNLPPAVYKGTEIQSTIIPLSNAPR
jgi:uncharacterized protein (TIGR02599 family)